MAEVCQIELIRFLQRGDPFQPCTVDLFGNEVGFSLRVAFSGDFARVHLVGGFEQGEPVRALGAGCVFAVQTVLRIGNTDVQSGDETFGTAEDIGLLQNLQNGFIFELPDLVEHDVPATDKSDKLGTVSRHA